MGKPSDGHDEESRRWYFWEVNKKFLQCYIRGWDIENVLQSFSGMFSVSGGNIFFSGIQTSDESARSNSNSTVLLYTFKLAALIHDSISSRNAEHAYCHLPNVCVSFNISTQLPNVSLDFLWEINLFCFWENLCPPKETIYINYGRTTSILIENCKRKPLWKENLKKEKDLVLRVVRSWCD